MGAGALPAHGTLPTPLPTVCACSGYLLLHLLLQGTSLQSQLSAAVAERDSLKQRCGQLEAEVRVRALLGAGAGVRCRVAAALAQTHR